MNKFAGFAHSLVSKLNLAHGPGGVKVRHLTAIVRQRAGLYYIQVFQHAAPKATC